LATHGSVQVTVEGANLTFFWTFLALLVDCIFVGSEWAICFSNGQLLSTSEVNSELIVLSAVDAPCILDVVIPEAFYTVGWAAGTEILVGVEILGSSTSLHHNTRATFVKREAFYTFIAHCAIGGIYKTVVTVWRTVQFAFHYIGGNVDFGRETWFTLRTLH